MKRTAILGALLVAGVAHAEPGATSPPAPPPADTSALDAALAELAASTPAEVIELEDAAPPGAHTSVSAATLERSEHDDIHRVLAGVAGVYLRDEDGSGLRPNIGMRGAAAERSAKIALMEDGVLIAPAPYSAPAAYYFPLVTRMSRVDVVKGPSAIQYGPNTVGGAVDLISAPMAERRAGYLDLALGGDAYAKVHARATERGDGWGLQGEYVKLRTDGWKQLDGGGDTGFDKDDASLWLAAGDVDLRAGYAHETSDETYLGLTDADLAASPDRRYRATADDQMNWSHVRLRADYRRALSSRARLAVTAYRHDFHRRWGKVDGFVGERDLDTVLSAPDAGAHPIFYAVLTGAADSQSPEEELIRGTNDRTFVSQGVQARLTAERSHGPFLHLIDAGVRMHFDRADRQRDEEAFAMVGGELMRSERPRARVLDSRAETFALAAYLQDRVLWRKLEVVAGLRVELLATRFASFLDGAIPVDGASQVVIPGGGVLYHLRDELALLAGVHRGFAPAAPGPVAELSPELAIAYEAGARWSSPHLSADAIGFFSDYSNLKGNCTLSSGCTAMQEGDQFDGGRAHILGLELQVAAEVPLGGGWALPLGGAYTHTRSEFRTAFRSDFAAWGDVEVGDELPYLPHHQLAASAAVRAPRGELGAQLRWHDAVRDVAGQGPIPIAERALAALTLDATAHVELRSWAELYVTATNLLDDRVVVSRRPYGARPNAPRQLVLGLKGRL